MSLHTSHIYLLSSPHHPRHYKYWLISTDWLLWAIFLYICPSHKLPMWGRIYLCNVLSINFFVWFKAPFDGLVIYFRIRPSRWVEQYAAQLAPALDGHRIISIYLTDLFPICSQMIRLQDDLVLNVGQSKNIQYSQGGVSLKQKNY